MSIHALSWVLRHSREQGTSRLVLLVLADHAKEDGSAAWPSVATMAEQAACSERAVQYALRGLEQRGAIMPRGTSRSGTTVYDLIGPGGADAAPGAKPAGVQPVVQGGATACTRTTSNRPLPEAGCVGAGAQVRVAGKPVVKAHWELAVRVLAAFNQHAGRKYRTLKSSGQPSEAAKYVYKRIREYPDLTYAEHVSIIERTVASRWWGEGPASFNVVYGPRVFEENITRPALALVPAPGAPATGSAEAQRLARQARRAAIARGEDT